MMIVDIKTQTGYNMINKPNKSYSDQVCTGFFLYICSRMGSDKNARIKNAITKESKKESKKARIIFMVYTPERIHFLHDTE